VRVGGPRERQMQCAVDRKIVDEPCGAAEQVAVLHPRHPPTDLPRKV
jgi:hypothetical protein